MNENWPPDYTEIYRERQRRYLRLKKNNHLVNGAKEYYKARPAEFINDWGITYDPRNAPTEKPTVMPFTLFKRQKELIQFLHECFLEQESGLIEKCRDFGATWAGVGFADWVFRFQHGSAVGWGSRKEQLVDKIGVMDSIFEKQRTYMRYIPYFFDPKEFDTQKHSSYMKILNPETDASITGESGDNIGRGGRTSIYFKDESAHYQRAESIEAALGDNTNCQIDFSSVNGYGTVFHRRRESGIVWEPGKKIEKGFVRVFIADWRDHPAKDQAWYDLKKAKAEREGLLNIFYQETDRDYTSNLEGIVIPAMWVKSAIDAHVKLGFDDTGLKYAGFDPFDEGKDSHGYCARKGSIITNVNNWAQGDTGQGTRKVISLCKAEKVNSLQYDAIGIGAGVKSEINRMKEEDEETEEKNRAIKEDKTIKENDKEYLPLNLPKTLDIQKWIAGAKVLNPSQHIIKDDPESPKNKDFYKNLKSQAWWSLRNRFEKTYKALTQGEKYDTDELISIPSSLKYRDELVSELSQPTYSHPNGLILIDKKPSGTKSPNLADATVMAFWPVPKKDNMFGMISGGPAGSKEKMI